MWLAISRRRVRMRALMSNKEKQMETQQPKGQQQDVVSEQERAIADIERYLWMAQEDFEEYMAWQREVEAMRSDAARGYA